MLFSSISLISPLSVYSDTDWQTGALMASLAALAILVWATTKLSTKHLNGLRVLLISAAFPLVILGLIAGVKANRSIDGLVGMLMILVWAELLRLWLWRTKPKVIRRDGLQLIGLLVLILILDKIGLNPLIVIYLALTQMLVMKLYNARSVARHSRNFKIKAKPLETDEAPSISLLIPARNEDKEMADFLTRALKSNYPKLEIIVYDDCSFDATPDIIRSFAHDGVRFISGKELNSVRPRLDYAFRRLADEAVGEIMVFCSTDVDLGELSLNSIASNFIEYPKVNLVAFAPEQKLSLSGQVGRIRQLLQIYSPIRKVNPNEIFVVRANFIRQIYPPDCNYHDVNLNYLIDKAGPGYRLVDTCLCDRRPVVKQKQAESSLASSEFYIMRPFLSELSSLVREIYRIKGHSLADFNLWFLLVALLVFGGGGYSVPIITWISLFIFIASLLIAWIYYKLILVINRSRIGALLMSMIGLFCLPLIELAVLPVSALLREAGLLTWKGQNVCYPPRMYRDKFALKTKPKRRSK